MNLIFTHGKTILLICLISTGIGYFIHPILGVLGILFTAFSIYFFRNPERRAENDDPRALISPADGKVVDIQQSIDGQFEGYDQKISIFLSPLDVHVNWIPMAGELESVTYKPGAFLLAFTPKSSELNERNDIVIRNGTRKLVVRQIAGTIARKIVWWAKPGMRVQRGDKYGMIRFGSRIDLLLPQNVTIKIKVGQRVVGGTTMIGLWSSI